MTSDNDTTTADVRPHASHLGRGALVLYSFAYFGFYVALATPVASTLAVKIAEIAPDRKEFVLGVVLGVAGLIGLLTGPVVGTLSDRTRSRLGRRRPWLLGGVVGGLISLALLGASDTVPEIVVFWSLSQLTLTMIGAMLATYLPDQVPESQRGRASAMTGIAQELGPPAGIGITSLLVHLHTSTFFLFAVPTVVGLALVTLLALRMTDPAIGPTDTVRPLRPQALVAAYWRNPRTAPDFAWAWIGRFLVILAITFFGTYQVYFLTDRFGLGLPTVLSTQVTLSLVGIVLVSAAASASGWLSDRSGRRKWFVYLSGVLLALAMTTVAFATSIWMVYLATAFSAVGNGLYFTVDFALVADVLPERTTDAAKDMGIINIANVLPSSLGPAAAVLLLTLDGPHNYTALYLVAAVCALAGGLSVQRIRAVR
jgi:MFS family permease